MTTLSSQLHSRNVTISGHRTSIRLEAHMWEAFDEICQREGLSAHELCSRIDQIRINSSRTAAVRAFAVNYFRSAATDQGHLLAGHGNLSKDRLSLKDEAPKDQALEAAPLNQAVRA